jgi:DNA primase catalytic core
MARIPDELLRRIREEVQLERLAEARGVELRRHGADLIGRCPFHDDREPSLVVTPAKNLWHCLGECQTGGSPIDWVMKAEGVSFRHAVEILRAEHFPTAPPLDENPARPVPQRSTIPKLAPPVDLDADDRELLGQVIGYYHQTLKESPEALGYLERRGLVNPEVIDRFKLGYANRTLGYRLPAMNRKAGQEIRTRLQKLGVLRDSGHEHLNGSLVVPILGEGGEVLGAYGRKITPTHQLRPGTPLHLYLPGPHRGVFNVEALMASKEVILCEALIDALTFWCAGFRNVTAAYGVEGFTHDHLAAFKTYGTEHVLIAYDRDEAGDKAAESLAKKLNAEGIACSRVQFPKGMDANEYALKVQPPAKAMGLLLRTAAWMGNGTKPAITASAAVAAPAAAEAAAPPPATLVPTAPVLVSPLPPVPAVHTSEQPAPLAAKEESLAAAAEEKKGSPADASLVSLTDDVARFAFGDRRYRILGLAKCGSLGSMRVSVRAEREAGDLFLPPSPITGWFQDTFDLGLHRQRAHFEKEAARELGVKDEIVRWDLGKVLRKLEEVQEQRLLKLLAPSDKPPAMSEEDREAALRLGRSPDLLATILDHYEKCGVVGEVMNKLALYLAVVSRKLERPLAVVIRSSSAAGKTALMEAVLAFVPKEEREKYSALTENSLFYFEGKDFKHKVLALVEEEGAQRAAYALKLLQSEGEITIASTGKDTATGKLVTKEYRVEGPVMILLTSTAIEIDEELLNRCLVLTVDEGREQTRAIHRLQREAHTLEGLKLRQERERLLSLHQNLQRLLRPLFVHNPWAPGLTFLDEKTRMRRDHTKYLALIDSIALLHQHQREIRTLTIPAGGTSAEGGDAGVRTLEYIEATLDDIALANGIASEVLGRSLDELPPQTSKLVILLDQMVTEACGRTGAERSDYHFSRRDVRRYTGWGHSQLCLHLDRLVALEYLLVHRGGRGQSFVYELLYQGEGKDGSRFVLGLMDAEKLAETVAPDAGRLAETATTTETFRGERGEFPGSFRAHSGAFPAPFRARPIEPRPAADTASGASEHETAETAQIPPSAKTPSYPSRRSPAKTPRNGSSLGPALHPSLAPSLAAPLASSRLDLPRSPSDDEPLAALRA